MKLAVASLNRVKILAVSETLLDYSFVSHLELEAVSVPSLVNEQPVTHAECFTGAKNRAKTAYELVNNCRLSFGIESGVMEVPGERNAYLHLTACVIYDGKHFHFGSSGAYELPEDIHQMIMRDGVDLNSAMNACGYTDNPELGKSEGAIGIFSKQRITRTGDIKLAVAMAMIPVENGWDKSR